jgi:hypothetical protein
VAQHDYVIANGTGAAVRSDINGALGAIATNNSGATEPTTTYAFQLWADTTTGLLKIRNAANSAWVELLELDGEFGSKTFNGNITLNAQGDLRFADSDSSNWLAFQAPATVASNVTWTLPNADGSSNQTLVTNGSGTLSWASPLLSSGGTITGALEIGSAGSLVFEGSTADGNETTLAVTDPTADRTITFPDATGTVALLGLAQTFSAAQRGSISALGNQSGTITLDMATANNVSLTLNANSTNTLANPTNLTAGQSGAIFIAQDSTGSRTLAYGTQWDFVGGTTPTLTTAANAVDVLVYSVRTTSSIAAQLLTNIGPL